MSKEELEKLEREKYVVERKLTAAMHKEKRLQSELKRLTRSERTHRLCTRAGMLETFLKEPTTLTDALATQHPEVCQRKARGEAGGVTYQVRGAALAIQPVRVS